MSSPVVIRTLRSSEELQEAVRLQHEIWPSPSMVDVVPAHVMLTAQNNGGVLIGAFLRDELVGILFGFLGIHRDGRFKHCSHLMGVAARARGRGVGRLLKLEQREIVIGQGIDLITWTHDPLEAPNASLNYGVLGAISRRYIRNLYGDMADDLNQGLPSDRLEAEWHLKSEHAISRHRRSATERQELPPGIPLIKATKRDSAMASAIKVIEDVDAVLVEIPDNFQQIKSASMDGAMEWRLGSRTVFERCFRAERTRI